MDLQEGAHAGQHPEDADPRRDVDDSASESDTSTPLPVLLFDGVCNLCNSAVQWVIEHDPDEVFHFASLQSSAAEELLRRHDVALDDLPDSMVLVDVRGVHTRSNAALGVGRQLGGVFAVLASLAAIVPRFLRDPIYAWIARNRYRWFGKRDVCRIPDAAERARFLDADEDVRVVEPSSSADGEEGEPQPTDAQRSSTLSLLPLRFLMTYFFVYVLPFPLSLLWFLYRIPGFGEWPVLPAVIGFIGGVHQMITQPIVLWIGRAWFGVEASVQSTGSGDMTFNYLDGLFDLLLAVVLTLIWVGLRRGRAISPVVFDVWHVLLRYYLATTMLSYGWVKAFPAQFPPPGPDRLLQPYGDSSPMGLLWTFMGASVGYQIFGGLMELLGGYLLFFRRTTLAGALVSVGVMTNIVALNVFYDVPVKLYSAHLVLIAVAIALPDLPRLLGMVLFNLPVASRNLARPWARRGARWWVALVLKILVIVVATWANVAGGMNSVRAPGGAFGPPHELAGVYVVETFEVISNEAERPSEAESVIESPVIHDARRWVRLGLTPPWVGTVQFADGTAVRMRLQVNEEMSELALYDRGLPESPDPPMQLSWPEEGLLQLEGTHAGRELMVRARRVDSDPLLYSRPFRWINEYPFNR